MTYTYSRMYDVLNSNDKSVIVARNKFDGYERIRSTMGFELNGGCGNKAFRSYTTDIARFDAHKQRLHVDWVWFDCSATTRRQFSNWLRDNNLPEYTFIKDCSKQYEPMPDGSFSGMIFIAPDGTMIVFDM